VRLRLQSQPFLLLTMLLERPGQLVTREEICHKLWSADTFVDFDHSLGTAINKIREVLGDSATQPRFIETLPRRGYRFIAPVTVTPTEPSPEALTPAERFTWQPIATGPLVTEPLVIDPIANDPIVNDPIITAEVATKAAGISPGESPHGIQSFHAIVAILILGILIPAIFFLWTFPNEREAGSSKVAARPVIKSIAVLPLANLSSDPNQQYLADGITDEIITNLAQISSIRVISLTSASAYSNTGKTAPQIARELGVDALVVGSVSRSGNKVRITTQLIHAQSDRHLWAHTYDREMDDVLTVQGDVAREVTESISLCITSQQ
jgi:TolB-like protein/DNA-binding winged helix-turn-helix (wHTH) protein